MKKNLVFIFLLSFNTAWSQIPANQKNFLMWFFNDKNRNQKACLYFANQYKSEINDLRAVLLTDTLADRLALAGREHEQNKLVLTKKEKEYISKEIDKIEKQVWPDHILPNYKIVQKDTIDFYLKDRARGWFRLRDKNIAGYYHMTRPIFLRKGTICIFQYSYNCGDLCGEGGVDVYKKDKTGWKRFINLDNWIS